VSDEPNIYAGIAKVGNDWRGSASTQPLAIDGLRRLWDDLCNRQEGPRYEVSFRCEHCGCAGIAVFPIGKCPRCDAEGVLNYDRGWEGIFPGIHFYEDGAEA